MKGVPIWWHNTSESWALGLKLSPKLEDFKLQNFHEAPNHRNILLCLSVQRCLNHTRNQRFFFAHSPRTTPVSNVKKHVKHLQSGEKAWSSQPDFFAGDGVWMPFRSVKDEQIVHSEIFDPNKLIKHKMFNRSRLLSQRNLSFFCTDSWGHSILSLSALRSSSLRECRSLLWLRLETVALNIDGSICFNMVYASIWFMVQCGLWFNMVQ